MDGQVATAGRGEGVAGGEGAAGLVTPAEQGERAASRGSAGIPAARSATRRAATPLGPGTTAAASTVERRPSARRVLAFSVWCATLALTGVTVGIRGLIAILVHAPTWYRPTLIILGLCGVAFAVGAIVTIERRRIPWVLLGLSSGTLIAGMIATSMAT